MKRVACLAALALALSLPARAQQPGDCSGDGSTAINELITGVNIALGSAPVTSCPPFDVDGDGAVAINELIAGVNAALSGGGPTPTPTDTPRPPTVTPSATPTRPATPTLRPTAAALQRLQPALAAAQQAALRSAAHTALLDAALAGVAATNGLLSGACAAGGSVTTSCSTAAGQATRRTGFSACRTALGGAQLERDGMIEETVDDPAFCARARQPEDAATVVFSDYIQRERNGSALRAELRLNVTLTTQPTGRTGCGGPDRDETLDGTLAVQCQPSATSLACPAGGADLTLTLSGVSWQRRSSGAPCARGLIASGRLGVDDRLSGDSFTLQLDELVLARRLGSGAVEELSIDGQATLECLGALNFSTTEPLQLAAGASCASGGGVLQVRAVNPTATPAAAGALRLGADLFGRGVAQTTPSPSPTAPVDAAFRDRLFRAANGPVYQVLQNAGSDAVLGADAIRITTVAAAVNGAVGSCANAAGVASLPQAVVGAEAEDGTGSPLAVIVPLAAVKKSGRLPDTALPCFNRNGAGGDGRLCVGSGCGLDCTCGAAQPCFSFTRADGQPLAQATTDVPAATLVPSLPALDRPCTGFAGRAAYGFGSGGPTTETDQCSAAPADGFDLPAGSTIVLVYDVPALSEVTAGAAGFPIDTGNGLNTVGCIGTRRVLSLGRASTNTVPAPRSDYGAGGVGQDYDGDNQVDARLVSCAAEPLRPCEVVAAPTPDPERPCNAGQLGAEPVMGTTAGGENRIGGLSCGWGGGDDAPDAVFEYVAPSSGRYVVAAEGLDFDPLLAVRRTQCRGAALGCSYDAQGTRQPRVVMPLVAGDRIAVMVDGEGGQQGNFRLSVAPQRPDLAIVADSLSVPSTGNALERVPVSVMVTNRGNGDAGPFSVDFLVARDAALHDQAAADTASCRFDGLAAGASVECTPPNQLVFSAIAAGTYVLGAAVDGRGEVTESDESNNVQSGALLLSVVGVEIEQLYFRAADGTAYQVLRAVPNSAGRDFESFRITSVAAAIAGANGCTAVGNMRDDFVSAIAGSIPPIMSLHPYNSIRRSAVLRTNDASAIAFDAGSGGRLTVGRDAGAKSFCMHASDCSTDSAVPTLSLTSTDGGVSPACIADNLFAICDGGGTTRDAFAFGLPGSGDPPVCTNPELTTVNTTVCAPTPPDGFTIRPGELVIFSYNSSLATSGFAVAAAGYGIDDDGQNSIGCPPREGGSVIVARVFQQAEAVPAPPTPTPTATGTITTTPTVTPTAVPTDAFEPDGVPGEAKPIVCGATQARTIGPGGEGDWVRFTLAAPSAVRLEALTDAGPATVLLNSGPLVGLELVAFDVDPQPPHAVERTCAAPLAAGTYHALFEGETALGPYDMRLTCTACS